MAVTLTGTGFVFGATVSISNSGASVSKMSVVSATQITATFTIAASATAGAASVTVTTSEGTSNSVTLTIAEPVSGMSLTLASTSSLTRSQVGVTLSTAPGSQLNGSLTLSFKPDPSLAGLPANYSDPAMQFASGGATLNFSVAAGSTAVTLPEGGAFQQGTVAGTITVTLSNSIGTSSPVSGGVQSFAPGDVREPPVSGRSANRPYAADAPTGRGAAKRCRTPPV